MFDGLLKKVQNAFTENASDQDGDPAQNNQFGDVRPASEDPYGDPADQEQASDVRPASSDSYGDPTDQESG